MKQRVKSLQRIYSTEEARFLASVMKTMHRCLEGSLNVSLQDVPGRQDKRLCTMC